VTEAVQKAAPEGVKWIANARKELPPTQQATTDLFDKLFGVRAVDPNTRAAERGSAVSKVNRILDQLSPHLDNTKRPCATDADLAAGGCHVCRNEQDGGCASGSPAYNRDPSPQTAGITHVCTSFVGESFDEQGHDPDSRRTARCGRLFKVEKKKKKNMRIDSITAAPMNQGMIWRSLVFCEAKPTTAPHH
jgi:hypothetical protein